MKNNREKEHNCSDVFVNRVSAYHLSKAGVTKEKLMAILEAGRWAPSSYNEQPWRVIYAFQGDDAFDKLLSSMVEFNQNWAKNAGVILAICANKKYSHNQKTNNHNRFDTGSFWMSLALEAKNQGLETRAIGGFDSEKVRKSFDVPEDVDIICLVAIGSYDKEAEKQSEEKKVASNRHKVEEFAFEGEFKVK